MDNSPITHLSLCAGYGGIDLGLRRCIPHLRTVAYSEIEAFAIELLLARMEGGQIDAAPIWTDLKSFPWQKFRGLVDILSGGYPCQPFSAAGKRLGTEDPRHLWPYIANGISILQPRLCFFENVEGHITLGLSSVISDLEELGYKVSWGIFSASECGAPHQRKRVFILAYRECAGLEGLQRLAGQSGCAESWNCGSSIWPTRPGQPQHEWEPPRVVADGNSRQPSAERTNDGEVCSIPKEECQPEHGPGLLGREGANGAEVVGDAKSERSATLGSEYARQRGELCSASSSCSLHAIVGDAAGDGRSADNRDSIAMGRAQCQKESGESKSGTTAQAIDGSSAVVGNAAPAERGPNHIGICRQEVQASGAVAASNRRQAQPSVGRDADGPSGGMDYAQLCVACDNRTDELRLLGNGVVPATAAKAFLTLHQQLFL